MFVTDDFQLQKFLSAGTFYFSWAAKAENYVDLSLSAQKRFEGVSSDSRFFWYETELLLITLI